MTLTSFAFRYRLVTLLVIGALLVLGIASMFMLPRREDPDLEVRWVQVIAVWPGASTRQVEQLVTQPLERALMEVDDMKEVRSTSRPGVAVFDVEASDHARNLGRFRDEIRDRVSDARASLPQGVVRLDVNDRIADTAALIVAVTWDGATDRERDDLARRLRDRLRRIPGAAEVKLMGEQQEQITVSLSSQRMSRLGVGPAQVADAVARRNVLPDSGGSIKAGDSRVSIQPGGELKSERDLADLVIAGEPVPVYLRDVATVQRGYADPSPFVFRVNGRPAVGVSVTMRKGRNINHLGGEVRSELDAFLPTLPAGAGVTVISDLPRSVEGRMGEFSENLLTGVALILIVMYVFMGLRSAALVGGMLPVTIFATFAGMYVLGRDLQQISIAALIIALGLVVDNSIVVVDNVERKMSEGLPPEQAAIEGTDELRIPLLTSNLTTIASFAPLLLLSGGVGEFVRDLGIVTTIATVLSLLLNYTLTPLIAARWLRAGAHDRPGRVRRAVLGAVDRLRDALSDLAERALQRPLLTVSIALLGLLLAVWEIPRLGTQFFPSAVRNQFTVDVWLPEGRDIDATLATAKRVEALLAEQAEVVSFAACVGQGGPRFYYNVNPEPPAPNYAQVIVNTKRADDTRVVVERLQRAFDGFPDARVVARTLEQGPPVGAPVALRLQADDLVSLRQAGEQVREALAQIPGTMSVHHNYHEQAMRLALDVDMDQAARAGLTSADVAQVSRMAFSGAEVSRLREGEREIPIELRLRADERRSASDLDDLVLAGAGGAAVPLRQVASQRLRAEESRIVRRNGVHTLTVFAFTDGSRLASAILQDAQAAIRGLALPAEVKVSYAGEQEEVDRTFAEMVIILGLAIVANLVIVAWEFNSARAAFTILAAVPLSMTGAILGLWLTGYPFGFMAFLGITSLAGVVTNHAIVMFEYAVNEQRGGMSLDRALLTAGRKRLRPILLTVLLSVGGLLPQGLNGGTLWPPMAWGLIAGLIMSLLLTLVVIPSFYKLLTLIGAWRARPAAAAAPQ